MPRVAELDRFSLTDAQHTFLSEFLLAQYAQADFPTIRRELDALESGMRNGLKEVILASQESMLRAVGSRFDAQAPRAMRQAATYRPPKLAALGSVMAREMERATRAGTDMVRREVPRAKRVQFDASVATVTPSAAVRAMRDKAFWASGVLGERLVDAAQSILIAAVRGAEPIGETVRKLAEAWLPWIGDETVLRDNEQLKPYRLETIVRTNVTDAYNTGRLAQMREDAEWLNGVRYSATIDDRTTELCLRLDGLVFRLEDPDLDRLTPPNHFNCRSLLVPVPLSVKVGEKEWATQEDIGWALDVMDEGFGGTYKYEEEEHVHG